MSTKRYPLIWTLALILLTIVACTAQEPAPVDSEVASGETPSPVVGDAVASTVPTVETLASPSPTPSPPAITKPSTPTRSAVSISNTPTAAAGLGPTATPLLTAVPMPTSTDIEGWLVYQNDFLGYRFSYPPEARISHHGGTGYPDDLCVTVTYKTGFVTVGPADEPLSGYASPCGITGIGDYTIEEWEEVVTINGQSYTANAMRLYLWQTDQLEHEYYLLRDFNNDLNIDFRLSIRGAPRSGQQDLTEAEFNEIRETLLQILASFRFFSPQADGE